MPNVAALSGTLGLETSPFVAGVNRAIASTLQMDKSMRAMSTSLRLSAGAASLFGGSVSGITSHIGGTIAHIAMLTREIGHMGKTFKSLIAGLGVGAGILAVSFAIDQITKAWQASAKAAEDAKKAFDDAFKGIGESSLRAKSLSNRLAEEEFKLRTSGVGMQAGDSEGLARIHNEDRLLALAKQRSEVAEKIAEVDAKISAANPLADKINKTKALIAQTERYLALHRNEFGLQQVESQLRVLKTQTLPNLVNEAAAFKPLTVALEAGRANLESQRQTLEKMVDLSESVRLSEIAMLEGKRQTAMFGDVSRSPLAQFGQEQNSRQDWKRLREEGERRRFGEPNASDLMSFAKRQSAMSENRRIVNESVSDFRKLSTLSGFAELQNRGKRSPISETIGESGSIGFREIERGMPSGATFGSQRFNSFQRTEETLDESKKIQHEQLQELKKLNAALTLN